MVATGDELISDVGTIGASGISEVVATGRGRLVVKAGNCEDGVLMADGVGCGLLVPGKWLVAAVNVILLPDVANVAGPPMAFPCLGRMSYRSSG